MPPRWIVAVGLLFGLGWVSTMIIALLHKIVPFLVWFHRYGSTVGKVPVPAMSDLTNERMGRIAFPLYHAALVLTVVGAASGEVVWARISAGVFAVACGLLLFDVVRLAFPAGAVMARLWAARPGFKTIE